MNNRLFVVLLVLINTSIYFAQQDTLLTKRNKLIPCTIHRIGFVGIEYSDSSSKNLSHEILQLQWYSIKGLRIQARSRESDFLTITKDSANLSEEIIHLRTCLNKFHSQYTTGLSITMIGAALGASTLFISKDEIFRKQLGLGGAILLLTGLGCSIDAHKWIGRAGWGVSGNGSNFAIHYRFK